MIDKRKLCLEATWWRLRLSARPALGGEEAAAVEALVRCGVDRVLTSGQRDTAVEGLGVIRVAVDRQPYDRAKHTAAAAMG